MRHSPMVGEFLSPMLLLVTERVSDFGKSASRALVSHIQNPQGTFFSQHHTCLAKIFKGSPCPLSSLRLHCKNGKTRAQKYFIKGQESAWEWLIPLKIWGNISEVFVKHNPGELIPQLLSFFLFILSHSLSLNLLRSWWLTQSVIPQQVPCVNFHKIMYI